jgi:biotin operon repressor
MLQAAGALGMPQPLLSRRIKNLERQWGTQIFDGSARGRALCDPSRSAPGQAAGPVMIGAVPWRPAR